MALTFDDRHYVPILKGKQGELNALEEADDPELRKAMTPFIEVPPIAPKWLEGERDPIPSKGIADHVTYVAQKFEDAIGSEWPVFLDGFYIEEDDDLPDGSQPITGIFNYLRDKKVLFIPVIGLDRVEEYGDAVASAIQQDGRETRAYISIVRIDGGQHPPLISPFSRSNVNRLRRTCHVIGHRVPAEPSISMPNFGARGLNQGDQKTVLDSRSSRYDRWNSPSNYLSHPKYRRTRPSKRRKTPIAIQKENRLEAANSLSIQCI